ncbi:MAG: AI-2E family transporter [Clostridiaceae bacterium]
MNNKREVINIAKYFLLAAVLVLIVKYSEVLISLVKNISNAGGPLILGLALAYVLNILMKKLEKIYFPKSKNKFINESRRAICILLSILLIIGVIVIISLIVVPELANAVSVIITAIPKSIESIKDFITINSANYEIIGTGLEGMQVDIEGVLQKVMATVSSILTGILNSIFTVVGSFTNGLMNFIIALTFAIYVLANKENLVINIKKVMKAFMKNKTIEKINYVFQITNNSFSNFIIGQCVEAVILGGLCTVGMLIFRFPYAATVGAFISATALIPVVGAYIGAALGTFMILTVDPTKALLFLVFISVLQQLENNLIYPRVVGSSIGLPGIWVFAAITIGGGLGGVMGMLLSVPIAASIYKLFANKVNSRLKSNDIKQV